MESIDKLREYCHDCCARVDDRVHDIADEIEAEIATRYMPLPVDADGVPWHIGEEIKLPYGNRDKVRFMTIRECDVVVNERGWVADQCRHVKPRTVEDVLEDFIVAFDEWDTFAEIGREKARDELFAKYADELRSMGVGE